MTRELVSVEADGSACILDKSERRLKYLYLRTKVLTNMEA